MAHDIKMSTVTYIGDYVTRRPTRSASVQMAEVHRLERRRETFRSLNDPRAPEDAELKWAPWKVTLAVLVFCSTFWMGVAYVISRLF
jgi:hypothetical protein